MPISELVNDTVHPWFFRTLAGFVVASLLLAIVPRWRSAMLVAAVEAAILLALFWVVLALLVMEPAQVDPP